MAPRPHRITVHQAENGLCYFVVDDSEQGFKRRNTAVKDAEREVPADTEYFIIIVP